MRVALGQKVQKRVSKINVRFSAFISSVAGYVASFPPSSRAPRVSLAPKTPFPFPLKRHAGYVIRAGGGRGAYKWLNICGKCFCVPLGNINCFMFCSVCFFWFVCLVFVTYNLAGEKATYMKCGRFDVACSRRKLAAIIYFSPTKSKSLNP